MRPHALSERARWLLLVLTLTIGLGGAVAIALWRVEQQGAEQQRDMCTLLSAIYDDPDLPPPTTERGVRQLSAVRRYLDRRC